MTEISQKTFDLINKNGFDIFLALIFERNPKKSATSIVLDLSGSMAESAVFQETTIPKIQKAKQIINQSVEVLSKNHLKVNKRLHHSKRRLNDIICQARSWKVHRDNFVSLRKGQMLKDEVMCAFLRH